MKATSHAMSKMILTLTSVAHYQLFLYLNKKCRDLTAVYNRSVTKFVPCGRPPRRLTCMKKNSSEYDSVIRFKPCSGPPDDRLSDDMYRKNQL